MSNLYNILRYYRSYWVVALFSIAASSLFEIIDLAVPYVIGQLLNLLSQQSLDSLLQDFVNSVAHWFQQDAETSFAVNVLLGIIFVVTVEHRCNLGSELGFIGILHYGAVEIILGKPLPRCLPYRWSFMTKTMLGGSPDELHGACRIILGHILRLPDK
jgi:ABC-type multidrug transport system fused ATPase/permease subunit